ncbi:MAG TPA: hypothetical protein PLV85_07365 [Polyangiaceae bacterium]|jgi:hypothetical protein|nr:hypothetical protein [Polyangiaceae bacterium]
MTHTTARRHSIPMALAFAVVLTIHLVLFVQVERQAPIFNGEPLSFIDFDTHAVQMLRVTEALDRWGKHWAYDVQTLAGYPEGTVFNADNKGWELWTYALWKLGLSRPTAFNLFVLFVHLLVPATVYLSSRLFRLEPWEALIATSIALGIWFFDGLGRWSWYSGGISFAFVSYLFLLPLSLFYAHFRTGKRWLLWPLAALMSLGHLVHPSLFVLLVVPMTGLYARHFRALRWTQHAAIVGVAVAVIGVNSWWLATAFRFAHYVTDHEPFFVGRLFDIVLDAAGLTDNLTRTGLVGNRTGFRFLSLIAGFMGLVLWRKQRDDRFLPFALGIGFLFVMAYAGGYVWIFRQIQPYRNIVPTAFLASIPAAAFVGQLARNNIFKGFPRLMWAPFGLLSFLSVLYLAKDVMYFLPFCLPAVPPLPTGEIVNITTYGFPPHRDFRHYPPEKHLDDIVAWVRQHDDGQSRFLVEWWVLGEHLLSRTQAQVLGGFRERNMEHRAANLFHRFPKGEIADDALARYLEQYAVRWVIVSLELPEFEKKPVLEQVATIGPHRIYRTRVPVSLTQEEPAEVSASLNRIDVYGTNPNRDVTLRFHWFETLVCEPQCRIERTPLADDPVGFIRVPAPHPTNFAIVNGY